METLQLKSEQQLTREKTARPILWLGIVSMVMLFAGLTSAYIVRQGEGNWNSFELPLLFWVSTSVIIVSSATLNWALQSAKKNNIANIKKALGITLALGILFVFCQFKGWSSLVNEGIFFTGSNANASGSFLYALTGLHLAHLVGGIIYLLFVFRRSLKNAYGQSNFLDLQLASIYWHFLDILWVYLFLFLLFIR